MFEHPDISKTIEKVIHILSTQQIKIFLSKFIIPKLYELITKKCASHCLQLLFLFIVKILTNEINEESEEAMTNLL